MYLAVDYGTRYIGLAATDVDGKITYRYGTLDQKQVEAVKEIVRIAVQERARTLVIGLPRGLSGQSTQQTTITQQFIQKLTEALPPEITVVTGSETLSSVEAKRNLEAEGLDSSLEHAEAARLLLEEYISSHSL